MSVMKTSLAIIPNVSSGAPLLLLEFVQAYPLLHKGLGHLAAPYFTLFTCYSLLFILSQNYLLPIISVLAEKTLLKTAYHFLLLLVGFDTLTYRKDYDISPTLVGHQDSFLAPLPGSEAPLVGCQCQNRRISGRGSRIVRLGRMVTGGRGHNVLPRFGPS